MLRSPWQDLMVVFQTDFAEGQAAVMPEMLFQSGKILGKGGVALVAGERIEAGSCG
jgi:hypothetical protein